MSIQFTHDGKVTVTQSEIARITGFSRSTVSTILAGKFAQNYSEETRKLVLDTARRLNYRPNRQALSLKTGESGIVGVVHTGSVLPVTHQRIEEVVSCIRDYEMEPLVYHNTWHENRMDVVGMLQANNVRAVILINNYYEGRTHELDRLRKSVPVIQFGGLKDPGIPLVVADKKASMVEMVRELARSGWKRFWILAPSTTDSLLNPLRAFHDTLEKEFPEAFKETVVVPIKQGKGEDVYSPGETGFEMLRDRLGKKTMVVAHNDNWAIGFYMRCIKHGVRVPEDIGLAGADDLMIGRHLPSPLTTIVQPIAEMASRCVELVMQPIQDPDLIEFFPCKLRMRASSHFSSPSSK